MYNFAKITKNLYRGSAPSLEEVKDLNDKLGITKIISLDKKSGDKISKICKLLGIDHKIFDLNSDKKSFGKLLTEDLEDLFLSDTPTFVHCKHGKDRTGIVSAILRCKYMDWSYEDAIKEAEKYGFGTGLSGDMINFYHKILKNCKSDSNEASIVDNERSYKGTSDSTATFLDEANQHSFSPHLSNTRQYPYDSPNLYEYNEKEDENSKDLTSIVDNSIPQVGIYNNVSTQGVGFMAPNNGFITGASMSKFKKADNFQTSFDIPKEEKELAAQAIKIFDNCLEKLNAANKYLDIMYVPFKNNSDIPTDKVLKYRAHMRQFRDNTIEKFNEFKVAAFKCVVGMNKFSTDTQTNILMKTFVNSISEMEEVVNDLSKLFDTLDDKDIISNILEKIDVIKSKSKEIEDLIKLRIMKHINDNILATNWVDNVSKDLNMSLNKPSPLYIDLYEKLQNKINKNRQ